jgi:hypothetical protein
MPVPLSISLVLSKVTSFRPTRERQLKSKLDSVLNLESITALSMPCKETPLTPSTSSQLVTGPLRSGVRS